MSIDDRETTMLLSEAANFIGVTSGRLRQMIRAGECRAKKVETPLTRTGYVYTITLPEARRLRDNRPPMGRPKKNSAQN